VLANGVAGTPMYLLPHNSGGTESEGLINHKRTPVLGRINFSVWAVTIHSSQITNHPDSSAFPVRSTRSPQSSGDD
jgi:hypothetical protein